MKILISLTTLLSLLIISSPAYAQLKRICVWGNASGQTLYYTVSTPTQNVQHKHRIRLYNRWDCFMVEGPVHRVFFETSTDYGVTETYTKRCDFNNVTTDGAFYMNFEWTGTGGNWSQPDYIPRLEQSDCIRQDNHDPIPRKEEAVYKDFKPPAPETKQ